MTAFKSNGIKAQTAGTSYQDSPDEGDCNLIVACDQNVANGEKNYGY